MSDSVGETLIYEEGDICPYSDCGGSLIFPPAKDCFCHICAPCSSCTSVELTCNRCGWTIEDEIIKPEKPVYPDEDFYDPDWRA